MNPMTQINSYLTFNGNCREAMLFYQECLGGELDLQTIGDSPLAERLPDHMKQQVLQATLINQRLVLMGTDMVQDRGLVKGNSVSLLLNCSSKEELRNYYRRLSAGGTATHPVASNHFGGWFGDLVDKYGNQWLLRFREEDDNYEPTPLQLNTTPFAHQ